MGCHICFMTRTYQNGLSYIVFDLGLYGMGFPNTLTPWVLRENGGTFDIQKGSEIHGQNNNLLFRD